MKYKFEDVDTASPSSSDDAIQALLAAFAALAASVAPRFRRKETGYFE
ncbi:hypothetical protein [Budvicia aquatica]|uniref:Uncharacterized protein n=1 Tax=Budvicia aquatica TaxID=82979 RepID=A0A484ZLD3_9GAMM|nr:hypothetical protein [Budvicia aquatica]VFS48718.1 Uncharacterised protein [Budvicia aquatica]